MNMPEIDLNEIIKIGNNFNPPKAQIVKIYSNDEKQSIFGDIEVVYYQNKLKGIKEDAVWNGEFWEFKNEGPSGTYVDINHYDHRLK
jgi:hypothetical protein